MGDIITIVGKRDEYKGTPQVAGAVLESVIPVTETTIAEVLTKPDSNTDYFMVSGEVTSIVHAAYGRLNIKENGSEIYIYGCSPGFGATGSDRDNMLSIHGVEVGDKLTVIARKGSYQGEPQLTNSFYFSHESAAQ
ncbi:MAG: hypothetical protein EOM12_15310 [Verrucomicrobiae bacterium]|nr:hypothetical protein [Verrucomicrobiae bacterium]